MTGSQTDSISPQSAEAVLKSSLGERRIRFEAGRLAQQAAGSVVTYLNDDSMVLSATTASKHPKDNLDFFPLTVDVEERQYAAGKIPGSFFRREGRPSEGRQGWGEREREKGIDNEVMSKRGPIYDFPAITLSII